MASLATLSDCSATRYCTASGQALQYGNQYVVKWNNQYPPLNTNSLVTVQVYSSYDLTHPILVDHGVSNTNGMIALQPDASWFSRYTGDNDSVGQNQGIYVAVFLQGNDPPSVQDMLSLQLTATPAQYAEIQAILHPSPTPSSSASPTPSLLSSTLSSGSSTHSVSDGTSEVELASATSHSSSSTTIAGGNHASGRSGLSTGAIVGIAVGSAVGLILILLLLLLPMYRRRQRRKRVMAKAAVMGGAGMEGGPSSNIHPSDGSAATAAAGASAVVAGGAARVLSEKERPGSASPSDTPLLLGGRPNNSFTSREDSLVDGPLSPRTAVYQPLSLESPRVMVNMPPSTRSARDLRTTAGAAEPTGMGKSLTAPDPILTTDDARQIGDIFRNALRQPPPPASEDGTSEGLVTRDSMLMHLDDELEEDEDPGWRERVASERMHRELEQEASVIRSVAMRAHGSDYSSSRPPTSQSDSSKTQSHSVAPAGAAGAGSGGGANTDP